jgi:hypothetical protein
LILNNRDSHFSGVDAKAKIVRAVLSRGVSVVGNVDGTVAGLLVSREGFQRLAHDERARANGDWLNWSGLEPDKLLEPSG